MTYSKTDWSSNQNTESIANEKETNMNSVSYNLYTQKGVKIDMNLCANIDTNIQVKLNGLDGLVGSDKTGFNPYDINSSYYSDQCLPMSLNESSVTIDEKRKSFTNLNFTCGGNCTYQSINLTTK